MSIIITSAPKGKVKLETLSGQIITVPIYNINEVIATLMKNNALPKLQDGVRVIENMFDLSDIPLPKFSSAKIKKQIDTSGMYSVSWKIICESSKINAPSVKGVYDEMREINDKLWDMSRGKVNMMLFKELNQIKFRTDVNARGIKEGNKAYQSSEDSKFGYDSRSGGHANVVFDYKNGKVWTEFSLLVNLSMYSGAISKEQFLVLEQATQ